MQERISVKKVDITKINTKSVANFLACALVLFPCVFTNIASSVLGNWGRLVVYLVALFFALYSESSGQKLQLKITQVKPLLLWGVVILLCLLNRNGDLAQSKEFTVFQYIFVILFALLFVGRNEMFMKNIIRVMLIYLFIQLIFGFYFLINPDVLLEFGTTTFNLDSVFYSKFVNYINNGAFLGLTSHYSTSGMYMALAVVLATSYVLVYRNIYKSWSIWYIAMFVVFFLALGLTQKRAHLLFSVVAILGMYLIGYTKGDFNRKMTQIVILIILFIIALIIFLQIPAFRSVISRFYAADTLDETSSGRISQLWLPALREFQKNPIFGMGWRQFKYVHPMNNGVTNDVHNIYLQFFAENGIIGGGYLFGLMTYNYISSWKLLLKSKYEGTRDEYLCLMFSFGYQTFFIFYGLTGNPFYDIQCFFPYLICCSITYYYQNKYKKALKANE